MLPLVLALFVPNVALLGADEWTIREREERKCDNLLSALLLPPRHDDPEIDRRVKALRTRHLKWLDPVYVERWRWANDYEGWVRCYFASGRSSIPPFEVFEDAFNDVPKRTILFAVMPDPYKSESFLRCPRVWSDYPRFLAWLDYHHYRAPMPNEVSPPPR